MAMLLLHGFDSLSGKAFTISTLFQPSNLLLLLGIGLLTGLVGGSYPAFYLSSFQPVNILKGALSKASGNVNLRRTLGGIAVRYFNGHAYMYMGGIFAAFVSAKERPWF